MKFKPLCSIQLKDRIEGRETIAAENTCMVELMQLITCLAENGYNNAHCTDEINLLRKCNRRAIAIKQARKAGIDEPTVGGKLSIREVNKLLKKYPNV